MSDKNSKPADNRSASQIKADLAAARTRMSANVTELVEEAHPKTIKAETIDDAKFFAQREIDNATSQVKDEAGWRTDRLAIIGGAAACVVATLVVVRLIVRKVRS